MGTGWTQPEIALAPLPTPPRGTTASAMTRWPPPEEKNAISHRGNALRAFAAELKTYLEKN
mgnify:CR=1 FL=1